MNPWEIILNVLGWGGLAIIALILAGAFVAILKALPSIWRKPPTKTTHIIKALTCSRGFSHARG